MPLTPIPSLDQSSTTFKNDVGVFFGTRIPLFVQEVNALQANLNAIAAGGAFSIPYIWGQGNVSGRLSTSPAASQLGASGFDIHKFSSNGLDVSVMLQQFDQSTNTIKGRLRIVKVADPVAQLVFNITARTDNGVYVHIDGAMVFASTTNPFAAGDAVMLYFDRAGDQGATGQALTFLIRDQKASGTAGQSLTNNTWNQRVINTTSVNTIPGAVLSNNVFALPAGSYLIDGSAPVSTPNTQHQIRLYNITDNNSYDVGTSEYTGNSGASPVTRSILRTYISLTAAKNFRIDHYVSSNVTTIGGGVQVSAGQAEFYTEIRITKVG